LEEVSKCGNVLLLVETRPGVPPAFAVAHDDARMGQVHHGDLDTTDLHA